MSKHKLKIKDPYININIQISKNEWLKIDEISGKEKINSISYNIKKIQSIKNWIESWIGFWLIGLNPHS